MFSDSSALNVDEIHKNKINFLSFQLGHCYAENMDKYQAGT